MNAKASINEFFSRFKGTYGEYMKKPGMKEVVAMPLCAVAFFMSSIPFVKMINYANDLMVNYVHFFVVSLSFFCLFSGIAHLFLIAEYKKSKKTKWMIIITILLNLVAMFAVAIFLQGVYAVFCVLAITLFLLSDFVGTNRAFQNIRLHRKTSKNIVTGCFLGITIMLLLVNYLIIPRAVSVATLNPTDTQFSMEELTKQQNEPDNSNITHAKSDLHKPLNWLTIAFGVATISAAIVFGCYDLALIEANVISRPNKKMDNDAGKENSSDMNRQKERRIEYTNENKHKTLIEITKDLLIELDLYDRVSIETIEELCKESVDDVVLKDKKERIGLYVAIAGLAISGIFEKWAENLVKTDILKLNIVVTAAICIGYLAWLGMRVRSVNKEEDAKEKREVLHIMRRIKTEINNKEYALNEQNRNDRRRRDRCGAQ